MAAERKDYELNPRLQALLNRNQAISEVPREYTTEHSELLWFRAGSNVNHLGVANNNRQMVQDPFRAAAQEADFYKGAQKLEQKYTFFEPPGKWEEYLDQTAYEYLSSMNNDQYAQDLFTSTTSKYIGTYGSRDYLFHHHNDYMNEDGRIEAQANFQAPFEAAYDPD